jgi:glycosyltransferase involved in cell wall biosynthesis
MNSPNNVRPKVTLGMPVYNGEKFLRKRLDSLLAQTFTDFELIISDNASTDSTQLICEEYAKKDVRIRYIRQKKNMGVTWNFNFVLQEAKTNYFAWIASDDVTSCDFIEKNFQVLESNSNFVASISKIMPYDTPIDDFKSNPIDAASKNFIKKLRCFLKTVDTLEITGTYEKKVRTYLKNSTCKVIYSLFRTDKLRDSMILELFVGNDWAWFLNVLKHGDLHVIDEVLMHEFESGISGRGIISITRRYKQNILAVIFPWYPLTCWCAKNLGTKIFLKNLDFFVQLNLEGMFSFLVDFIRLSVHKISKK